ncbi:urea transporter [Microcoleus sp. A003_D6]|uniref:urea transporter n=1 Tax=Microcoleus sp. A003_D6 TaxID=3055266 RepID=UPI002FD4C57C
MQLRLQLGSGAEVSDILAGILFFLAVALCTPIGAAVGLLGCILGVLAGGIVGVAPEKLYAGLWGLRNEK